MAVTKKNKIEQLKNEIQSLKNIIDMKDAEISALKIVNDEHKKLNGQLRKEIDDLKKEAKEMLQYPWLYLVIQYTENTQKKYTKYLYLLLQ